MPLPVPTATSLPVPTAVPRPAPTRAPTTGGGAGGPIREQDDDDKYIGDGGGDDGGGDDALRFSYSYSDDGFEHDDGGFENDDGGFTMPPVSSPLFLGALGALVCCCCCCCFFLRWRRVGGGGKRAGVSRRAIRAAMTRTSARGVDDNMEMVVSGVNPMRANAATGGGRGVATATPPALTKPAARAAKSPAPAKAPPKPPPPAAAGPPPLPPGWTEHPDPEGSGDSYYWCEATNETTWERPARASSGTGGGGGWA